MEFNWMQMWQAMSPLAKAVAGLLLILGLASLAVFIERWIVLYRHRKSSREFIKHAEPLLQNPKYQAVLELSGQYSSSFAARMVGTGIQSYLAEKNPAKVSSRLERYFEAMTHDMRRGMTVLSTVGSTAPFIGLLGTVIGIVSSFKGIAKSGSGGLAAVSAGISEALVETALKAIAGELTEKMEESSAREAGVAK